MINAKGGSKAGCLVAILILLLGIWTSYKILPPYYQSSSFFDNAQAKLREAANRRWPKQKIEDEMYRLARKYEQPGPGIEPRKEMKIEVFPGTRSVTVKIQYKIHIDLGFYKFDMGRDKELMASRLQF